MSPHATLPALLALLICSCGGKASQERIPGPLPVHPADELLDAELPAAYRHQEPALTNAPILNYLPDATMAALVLKSPRAVAKAIDSTAIFRDYGSHYQEAAKGFSLPNGGHLWEAETWDKFGIDSDAAAGAAFWIEEDVVGVFFVSLADPELFLQSMQDLASLQPLPAPNLGQIGSVRVLNFGKSANIALLVRDKVGVLVLVDRSDDMQRAIDALAGSHSVKTLAESGRVARAFAGLDFGEDLTGFVSFDNIAKRIAKDTRERRSSDWYSAEVARLESAIESAKTERRPQAEIDKLESELTLRLKDHNRHQLRRTGEARLLSEVWHPLGTVAFGIDLDGATTRGRVQMQPAADSLPANLLKRGSSALALPSRLRESPLFMLGARVSSDAAEQLLDLILQSDGDTRASAFAEIKEELGVAPGRLLALLAGEVSGAMTFNYQSFAEGADSEDSGANAIGMHILLELNDPAAARALMAEVMASPRLATYATSDGERPALEVPGWSRRKIRIEIVDRFLEVRSVDAAESAPIFSAAESELFASPASAAIMLLDPIVLSWFLFGMQDDYYNYYGDQDSPASPAARARIKEIDIEKKNLQRRQAKLESEYMLASSKAVGRLALTARPQAGGYAFLASLQGQRDNLGRALQSLFEGMLPELASARLGARSPLQELRGRLRELESERWRLLRSQP